MTKTKFKALLKKLPHVARAGAADDPEAIVEGMVDRGMLAEPIEAQFEWMVEAVEKWGS